ncbi:hypothetical protein LJR104_004766 [Neorhizobium sp. LjRoot104]
MGVYLGLTPRRKQSGEMDTAGQVLRWGDRYGLIPSRPPCVAPSDLALVRAESLGAASRLELRLRTCRSR